MTFTGLPMLKHVPSPNFSSRNGTAIDLIVLHDTEGGYAGSVNWFANSHSEVSAHLVLKEDGSEATMMVNWTDKAWHVVNFNSRAIGLEMAGFAKAGYGEAEWQAAANIIAWLLAKFKIPVRSSPGGSIPGFCTHAMLGQAGGGHSDPTVDPAVWEAFVKRVESVDISTLDPLWDTRDMTSSAPPPPPPGSPPVTPTFAITPWPALSDDPSFFAAGALIFNKFKSLGASNPVALGLLAQAEAESSLNPHALGDNKTAYGLFQMHADRVAALKVTTGIDLCSFPPIAAQVTVAWYELTKGAEQAAFAKFKDATTALQAGQSACAEWERAGASQQPEKRGAMAERWTMLFQVHPELLTANPAPAVV